MIPCLTASRRAPRIGPASATHHRCFDDPGKFNFCTGNGAKSLKDPALLLNQQIKSVIFMRTGAYACIYQSS